MSGLSGSNHCYRAFFAYQLSDEALAQARRVDTAVAAGEDPGRLAGVPVVVKELCNRRPSLHLGHPGAEGLAGRPEFDGGAAAVRCRER